MTEQLVLQFHIKRPERLKKDTFDIKNRMELALNTGFSLFHTKIPVSGLAFMKVTIVPRTAFRSGQKKLSRLQYYLRQQEKHRVAAHWTE